ncbi:hypothetical protein [Thermotalea metallivorans]|uniref:Uncharacterized protein n=1 Tax=Thermotalea metallivorans TaxID=520762 RepID=A0A140L9J0_9FIRM|nr:hypothetical protein [Thermotalea metallivorans]KXG77215.1 hypothetical protein AN619_07450 [Thermotalea metallivorans]
MEQVCPICNAMAVYLLKCPVCGNQMENIGALQEFFDDYSPYLPMDITQRIDDAPHSQCVHLFYCKTCHYDKRIPIDRVIM